MWTVRVTALFEAWLFEQDEDLQVDMAAALRILATEGPQLGRPYVDTLKGAKLANLKELRVQSNGRPFRGFFVFDPQRNAIVLCAGNKKGQDEKRFYKTMIATAESEYAAYLEEGKQDANKNA
ncbi:diaminopimelate decarboxylase [Pantoea sp. YU22]|uniref:type II toxin-antitoxin system RelE/ParE family toxin n=1 Tax=Pantoea sp. YU22 TaxID=2497684 RepID=UPI000F89C282|nr:type II toxin-antitoxin system RelE/ParE family toxin [Pantoea sp. YU22]RTY53676.1 diaminopimelate decarboxylase [Pantoea sp. YU22]